MSTPKVRDVVAMLRAVGAIAIRTRGSHQVWRLPTGLTAVVVINHMNDDASGSSFGAWHRCHCGLGRRPRQATERDETD